MLDDQKAKFYVRLFTKENHFKDFLNNYLYMNEAIFFSKYDDELIGDITEGKIFNGCDEAKLIIGKDNPIVIDKVEMPLYNWYIYCLFELFDNEVNLKMDSLEITSIKFQNFINQYLISNKQVFIVLIDSEKFDQVIKKYLVGKEYFYDDITFSDLTPSERFMAYMTNGVKSILYNKKLKYAKYFSEKRLSVFHDEKKDKIILKIEGIKDSIINIYTKKAGEI